jgi:hypothetical protein
MAGLPSSSETKKLAQEYSLISSHLTQLEGEREKLREERRKLQEEEKGKDSEILSAVGLITRTADVLISKFLSECKNSEQGLLTPDGKILILNFTLVNNYTQQEGKFEYSVAKLEGGKLHVSLDFSEYMKKNRHFPAEVPEVDKNWKIPTTSDSYENKYGFTLKAEFLEKVLNWYNH